MGVTVWAGFGAFACPFTQVNLGVRLEKDTSTSSRGSLGVVIMMSCNNQSIRTRPINAATQVLHLAIACVCLLCGGCASEPTKTQKIESNAVQAIDFESLKTPVRDYLKLAIANQVVGHPVSQFTACLALAEKKEVNQRNPDYEEYTFFLPMHVSFIQKLKTESGTDCWPAMHVVVDLKSQKVRRTLIYIQYL